MKRLTIFLTFFLCMLASPVLAGGGRFNLYTSSSETYHTKEAYILAQVYTVSINSPFAVDERVEFRIRNPQEGDRCVTELPRTDSNGFTRGKCYANSAREMRVYLASLDLEDESGDYMLYFRDPPKPSPTVRPTQKPSATTIPTVKLTPTPQASPTSITIKRDDDTTTLKQSPIVAFFLRLFQLLTNNGK